MYCLTNLCYVCLKMKNNLKNINNSYTNNEKLLRIIDCFAFNLSWLRHKSIILICEECCIKLEESYQFMEMCHENSAILQGYVSLLDYSPISDNNNEAKLMVMLEDINKVKQNNIKLEAKEEQDNFEPIIEEEQDTLNGDINEEVSCANEIIIEEEGDILKDIKKEIISEFEVNIAGNEYEINNFNVEKRDSEILPNDDNNKMEYCDIKNEIISDIEVNIAENIHEMNNFNVEKRDSEILPHDHNNSINNNDNNNSKVTYEEVHTSSKKNVIKTKAKIFQCSICGKCFASESYVYKHMVIHSGKKPHQCSTCNKSFVRKSNMRRHMRIHSEAKSYQCLTCKEHFTNKPNLNAHRLLHCGNELRCVSFEKKN